MISEPAKKRPLPHTGFVCEERYFWHDNGSAVLDMPSGGLLQPGLHIESPESKRRLRNLLEVSGLLEKLARLPASMATEEDILRFHTPGYVDRLRETSSRPGGTPFDDTSYVSHGSYEIAQLSAGGVIAGISRVLEGRVRNAYCLTRPPGHHATPDRAMGFCLLGNIPIALLHAQAALGLRRAAVFDWDVHHGNGTETAFYDRSDMLTISIHQAENYPLDSGAESAIGVGEGEGFNVNIPLQPGSGIGAYEHALNSIVIPALKRFRPELIVIACGFDASFFDPLGRQLLPSKTYGDMTRALMRVADEVCEGRIVAVHEGGYSEAYVPFCGVAVVEALAGETSPVVDPYLASILRNPAQSLQQAQCDVIERVRALHNL
jgi:acetoin utilization deacetylase AcuC-like enzyme